MNQKDFKKLVAEGFEALPERFRALVKNVAIIVEDEPSAAVRAEEGLAEDETLFGRYVGIPHTERGDSYGIGATLPDVITIYQKPTEEEAEGNHARIREIVCDTVWHEIAHHFGMDEPEVRERERKRL
ncbi:MAG: hypothetical protein A2945_04235 [Candidatus Liptonbacteria bacterium RIFCSPLOWO2_01_FULL_52_25]|uniref:Metallopeptidase family protein n=1 Tax=Candidatus Liptonbacteria bacterium RIFCSPLOWO2_01_FULL_52_25 TaxID=1798650 RepID=A0A1G2CER5_9BACT|nr:MAG: hypothetical protein A2945_04235 [Candidatus Liptonbacteria bacterium RIFCSPLOWO2_01_FULL_52_25]